MISEKKLTECRLKYAQAKEAHSLLIECMNLSDLQTAFLLSSYAYLEESHEEKLINEK